MLAKKWKNHSCNWQQNSRDSALLLSKLVTEKSPEPTQSTSIIKTCFTKSALSFQKKLPLFKNRQLKIYGILWNLFKTIMVKTARIKVRIILYHNRLIWVTGTHCHLQRFPHQWIYCPRSTKFSQQWIILFLQNIFPSMP